jgi:hydroxyethylthiazole kinase
MTEWNTPGAHLKAWRAQPALAHCITNSAAMNIAANSRLAVGASPAMVHAAAEANEFSGFSAALAIKIGMLSPDWVAGMTAGARCAARAPERLSLGTAMHYPPFPHRWTIEDVIRCVSGLQNRPLW